MAAVKCADLLEIAWQMNLKLIISCSEASGIPESNLFGAPAPNCLQVRYLASEELAECSGTLLADRSPRRISLRSQRSPYVPIR